VADENAQRREWPKESEDSLQENGINVIQAGNKVLTVAVVPFARVHRAYLEITEIGGANPHPVPVMQVHRGFSPFQAKGLQQTNHT
jgi:hypothetical protein